MEPRYLNVDLILRSKEDLTPIADFFCEDVFLLWNDPSADEKSIGMETTLDCSANPQEDLVEFLRLLATLPTELIGLLNRCSERIADIGFESGASGDQVDTRIDAHVVSELSKLQITIGLRVYPIPSPE